MSNDNSCSRMAKSVLLKLFIVFYGKRIYRLHYTTMTTSIAADCSTRQNLNDNWKDRQNQARAPPHYPIALSAMVGGGRCLKFEVL